jgi:hypothetical protein
MDLSVFESLPDESRVWIHPFKTLTGKEQERITKELERFLPEWAAHGAPVRGVCSIFFDRFVVTAGYCAEGISGCSTDSLIQTFKVLKTGYGLDGLQGGVLYYRDENGEIQAVTPKEFREEVEAGRILAETPIFQTLLSKLGELRTGQFEVPFEESSLARMFPLPTAK